MKIIRILYFGYYIKKLDYSKFKKFLNHTSLTSGKSKFFLFSDMLYSIFSYNISILEYFQFRFFELKHSERKTWAGSGYMYEYQKRMNPIANRSILSDKKLFDIEYKEFIKHFSVSLDQLASNNNLFNELIQNRTERIVIKSSTGGCGIGIEVLPTKDLTEEKLRLKLIETGNDLVEDYVVQHDDLMNLSSSGLNTIRIITQLTADNKVEIIGCRLRITVNSHVDNLAAGNIVASINTDTGEVYTDAVYSDMTKPPVTHHPITALKIKGFKVPHWPQTIELIKKAACKNSKNKSIGWDVAITNNGPELIEGNHDWCKLVWQLPEQKGLKPVLDKYL